MRILTVILFVLLSITSNVSAQTYNIDPAFNTGNAGATGGSVYSILQQPDGKIIVGGSFTAYNGIACKNLIRLNLDGTLDTSFNIGTGPTSSLASTSIRDLVIDLNGKILVAGYFTSFNGNSRNCIARLNDDGSIDNSFSGVTLIINPNINNTSVIRRIESIKLTQDGKVLIGGDFRVTGQASFTIYDFVRLNTDGSFDSTFIFQDNIFETESIVTGVDLQSDNKIIVSVINFPNPPVLRFNPDGSKDTSFLSSPYQGSGFSVLVAPDDKIFLGGLFQLSFGALNRIFVKLNSDGSLDSNFAIFEAPSGSSANNVIYAIKRHEGKILIGGNLSSYGGVAYNSMARLNGDGTVDESFVSGTGPNSTIQAIDVDSNNRILIGGNFSGFNGLLANRITRLLGAELSLDEYELKKINFLNNGYDYIFQASEDSIANIYFYDITGKKLQELRNINSLDYKVPNVFPKGVKLIRVEMASGSFEVFKTID